MRALHHLSLAVALILSSASWGLAKPVPAGGDQPKTDDDEPQKVLKHGAKKVFDASKRDLKYEDELDNNDAGDTARQGSFAKVYLVKLAKGKSYVIDMMSTKIDSYLRLEDDAGMQLAEDDDGGGNLNARIRFTAGNDGTYRVIATTFVPNMTGAYTLTINQRTTKLRAFDANKVHSLTKDSLSFEHELANADPGDAVRQGSFAKVYQVKLEKGKSYTIDMKSTEIDSYLRLEDNAGTQLAEDDDGGVGHNARIRFTANENATFRIIATSFGQMETGAFTLTINRRTVKAFDATKVHALAKGSLTFEHDLANTDPADTARQGSHAKVFQVKLEKGKSYTIDLKSTEFDSYLRLEDNAGTQLAEDDDSGGFPDARIRFTAADDGTYRIIATSFAQGQEGAFTLTVRED